MDSRKTTNLLLALIAALLCFVSLKSGGFGREAYAQPSSSQTVLAYGCYYPSGSTICEKRAIAVDAFGQLMDSKEPSRK